ncbi:MAG: hypothetical protein NZ561_02130 [Phycisphaerae bacterium]|nr:hypothetical protein [Phycisphaerae bacterium]MDW8261173.1 hypothetical protein [Phycisphaerales bacterium]
MWDYIKAAFNARPAGMFVPPNWVFVAGVALLGSVVPGLWLIGAGLELAYLVLLSSNRRFQRFVAARKLAEQARKARQKQQQLVQQLSADDRAAYLLLEQRCQSILQQQRESGAGEADLLTQSEGLSRLTWIFLRLLLTRQSIVRLLRESIGTEREGIDARVARLQRQLQQPDLSPELRRSLEGQLQILQQRAGSQREARDNLAFIESELARIREQVELIKEQAVLSTDPANLSHRIDEVGTSLAGTTQWMRDRQEIFGRIESLMDEPPAGMMQAQ